MNDGRQYALLIERTNGYHYIKTIVHIPEEVQYWNWHVSQPGLDFGAKFQLMSRELPEFENVPNWISPHQCLEQFGNHNYVGEYAVGKSRCSRCWIYE